jgi:hypothetical protein
MSKGVTELIGELQVQLGMLLSHIERGKQDDYGRFRVDIPRLHVSKAREALDASYGKEVATK